MKLSNIGRLCSVDTGEPYLDHDETAKRIGLAPGTLYNWRYLRHPHIAHVKFGGRAYYLEREVDAYVRLHGTPRAA